MENDMGDDNGALIFGIIIGIVMMCLINAFPFTDSAKYREAIKECEKSLPRDQHCVVVGLPVSKD
jgi:hypothetical protein